MTVNQSWLIINANNMSVESSDQDYVQIQFKKNMSHWASLNEK